jgi:hypothetical protein
MTPISERGKTKNRYDVDNIGVTGIPDMTPISERGKGKTDMTPIISDCVKGMTDIDTGNIGEHQDRPI